VGPSRPLRSNSTPRSQWSR